MAGTTSVAGMEVPNWLMVAAGEWQGSAEAAALGARNASGWGGGWRGEMARSGGSDVAL